MILFNATVAASHELNATVAASHGSLLAATHESPLRMRHDEHSFKETKRNTIAWQKGYYDERIRDGRQFTHAMHYVQGNAMRHRLVQDILGWPWSSLLHPHLLDTCAMWIDYATVISFARYTD